MPSWLSPHEEGVEIDVLVVPRASRTKIVGEHESRLKVQLNAPPVDGEANRALIKLLAKTLGARKSDVQIVSGETGRRKRVRVFGMSADAVEQLLLG